MTTSLYWQCAGMYFIGQILHFLVVKLPSVRNTAQAANKPFSLGEYFRYDWNMHIANFAFGLALLLGADQVIQVKPAILNIIKWLFIFMGIGGSSIALGLYSAYKNHVLRIIDVKTNVSDSIAPISNDQAAAIGKATKNAETQVEAVAQITEQKQNQL